MRSKNLNHPFVTWAACLLWLISMFALTWSLLIFFCMGDMLLLTGTDLVNAFTLLSGLLMFPTNVFILYSIATGRTIDHKDKVVCCPLWLSIFWIIIINIIGVILCIRTMNSCHEIVMKNISSGITFYRTVPKYKHFVDNMQWSLKCCGLKSYRDWFNLEWHDKIRDYEWNLVDKRDAQTRKESKGETDSVPFSSEELRAKCYRISYSCLWHRLYISYHICCKSGSCISNYLKELGTYSINTDGCGHLMYRIIMISMNAHLFLFLSIIIIEALLLKFICVKKTKKNCEDRTGYTKPSVQHIMPFSEDFEASSESFIFNQEDSDCIEPRNKSEKDSDKN